MTPRLYLIDTGWQTVSAVQDLLEVKLGAYQYTRLHSARVMSVGTSEVLAVSLCRLTVGYTSGSGGGAATATKYGHSSLAAHGLAALERNNTTKAVAGTGARQEVWPGVLVTASGEWEFSPPDDVRPQFDPDEAVALSLDSAPAAGRSMRASLLLQLLD